MKHDLVANMIKDEDAYLHIGINYQKNSFITCGCEEKTLYVFKKYSRKLRIV